MPSMTRDEVARVAALARIALAPDEIDRLVGELGIIVSSVASVSEVATADVPATSHPLPLVNVLRADVPEPALSQAEALAGAPAAEDGKFLVPQILGEEGSAGE